MTAVLKKKLALVKSRIVKYCSSLNVEVPKVISTEEAHENWRIENRNKMAMRRSSAHSRSVWGLLPQAKYCVY